MKNKFAYIEIQMVGDLDNYGYSYTPSEIEFDTPTKAFNAGVKELEHDDFIVGEFEDGGKGKCVAVWLEKTKKDRHTTYSNDYGHYVRGVNEEIGMSEY